MASGMARMLMRIAVLTLSAPWEQSNSEHMRVSDAYNGPGYGGDGGGGHGWVRCYCNSNGNGTGPFV